jgi:hypothetical protein
VLAHARAQSAWRLLDTEYAGIREQLTGHDRSRAEYFTVPSTMGGGGERKSSGLLRPRTAHPAGRTPAPEPADGTHGIFAGGASAAYHAADVSGRPRPKSASAATRRKMRESGPPLSAGSRRQPLSCVAESSVEVERSYSNRCWNNEPMTTPIAKPVAAPVPRAAIYASASEYVQGMDNTRDYLRRPRSAHAGRRPASGGRGSRMFGARCGYTGDENRGDEDESIASFIKEDSSEAETALDTAWSPVKEQYHGDKMFTGSEVGRRVERVASGDLDELRMTSQIVQLQRMCAEKDTVIGVLESEIRRLDSALGEEVTLKSPKQDRGGGGGCAGVGDQSSMEHGERISEISLQSTQDSTLGISRSIEQSREEEEVRSLVARLEEERTARAQEAARAEAAERRLLELQQQMRVSDPTRT